MFIMKTQVLEVNVDDLHSGGVFSLIKSVIINKPENIKIDIAAIEQFIDPKNIEMLHEYGTDVYYIGYLGSKLRKQIRSFFNLRKLLKEHPYDCVHIHADVANKLFVSGLAAKSAGTSRIILHSHAAGVDGNHRSIKKFIHKVCRLLLKKIGTEFVSCSDLAAKWMYPNIEKFHIKIINNGVDLDKFKFNDQIRKQIRKELGLRDELLIGHVGRFAYQKNHAYLISILKAILEQEIDAKLLLVGEGPDEQVIREMVKQNKFDDYVIFFGTSNQVQNLFQAMDIFVLPSHFEGLPIVGVEAQAAGLPVIFSDQITREAKLTNNVIFLPIEEKNISEWVEKLQELLEISYNREDCYEDLKRRKFRIQDTVDSFLTLYQRG